MIDEVVSPHTLLFSCCRTFGVGYIFRLHPRAMHFILRDLKVSFLPLPFSVKGEGTLWTQVITPLLIKLFYYQHFLFFFFRKGQPLRRVVSRMTLYVLYISWKNDTFFFFCIFFPQFRGPCLGSEPRRWKGKARTASMIQVGVRSRPGRRPEGEAAIDSYWKRTAYWGSGWKDLKA